MIDEQEKRIDRLHERFDEFSSLVRVILVEYVRYYNDINYMATILKHIISVEADKKECIYKEENKT